MKTPGIWLLVGAWVLFAATGLWSVGVGQFVYLAVTGGMALFFTALFVVLGMCAAREKLPLDLTKLPSPEYWLSPEHRPVLNALFAELMYEIGAGLVLFVALLNVGLSAGWSWIGGPLALFLAAVTLVAAIRFSVLLRRVPRAE